MFYPGDPNSQYHVAGAVELELDLKPPDMQDRCPVCEKSDWVNIGFHTIRWACKHDGTDRPSQSVT